MTALTIDVEAPAQAVVDHARGYVATLFLGLESQPPGGTLTW